MEGERRALEALAVALGKRAAAKAAKAEAVKAEAADGGKEGEAGDQAMLQCTLCSGAVPGGSCVCLLACLLARCAARAPLFAPQTSSGPGLYHTCSESPWPRAADTVQHATGC
jgi:hypothetical protein